MTPRRSSRLVPVLLVGSLLLAATPGLAAPAPERPVASSLWQVLDHLWVQLTGSFTRLFAAPGEGEAIGGSTPDSSPPAANDDPLVHPQHGHDYDPNG